MIKECDNIKLYQIKQNHVQRKTFTFVVYMCKHVVVYITKAQGTEENIGWYALIALPSIYNPPTKKIY